MSNFINISLLLCVILIDNQVELANIIKKGNQNTELIRNKRTLSSLSSWWYGESETETEKPIIKDVRTGKSEANYVVKYPYHGYDNKLPLFQNYDTELVQLAQELGIYNVKNLPNIEEIQGLIGTSTKSETIEAIRDFAKTPGGIDLIKDFLNDDNDRETQSVYKTIDSHSPSVHLDQSILFDRQLEAKIYQPRVQSVPTYISRNQILPSTQILDERLDKIHTNTQIVQEVIGPHEEPSVWSRIWYYLNFLNIFGGRKNIEVPLPENPKVLSIAESLPLLVPAQNNPLYISDKKSFVANPIDGQEIPYMYARLYKVPVHQNPTEQYALEEYLYSQYKQGQPSSSVKETNPYEIINRRTNIPDGSQIISSFPGKIISSKILYDQSLKSDLQNAVPLVTNDFKTNPSLVNSIDGIYKVDVQYPKLQPIIVQDDYLTASSEIDEKIVAPNIVNVKDVTNNDNEIVKTESPSVKNLDESTEITTEEGTTESIRPITEPFELKVTSNGP